MKKKLAMKKHPKAKKRRARAPKPPSTSKDFLCRLGCIEAHSCRRSKVVWIDKGKHCPTCGHFAKKDEPGTPSEQPEKSKDTGSAAELRAIHQEMAALTARVDSLCGVLTPAAAPR